MNNIPKIKVGLVAVSRDCFPAPLAVNRRKAVAEAYAKKYDANDIYECPITIVESEIDMVNALEDIKKNGCNALCVYLGNFGPQSTSTARRCFARQPRNLRTRSASRDAAMRTAAC